MKRALSVILAAIMVLTVSLSPMVTLAAGTPVIQCADVTCDPGDRIDIPVTIQNNPGTMVLIVTPEYSPELGTPHITNGPLISDITMGLNYVWLADNDVTVDGTLFTVSFDVPKDLAPGKYPVGVIFREACNANEELFSMDTKAGTVTVRGTAASTADTSVPKTSASDDAAQTSKETSAPEASLPDESSQPAAEEEAASGTLLISPNPLAGEDAADASSEPISDEIDASEQPTDPEQPSSSEELAEVDGAVVSDAESDASSGLWLKVAVFALICLAVIVVLLFVIGKKKKKN